MAYVWKRLYWKPHQKRSSLTRHDCAQTYILHTGQTEDLIFIKSVINLHNIPPLPHQHKISDVIIPRITEKEIQKHLYTPILIRYDNSNIKMIKSHRITSETLILKWALGWNSLARKNPGLWRIKDPRRNAEGCPNRKWAWGSSLKTVCPLLGILIGFEGLKWFLFVL